MSGIRGRSLKGADLLVSTISRILLYLEVKCSEIYAGVPESWSQNETYRALEMASPVVYLYFTDLYCDGTAASILVGCIGEAEYAVLFIGALLRAVRYGLVSRFALIEKEARLGVEALCCEYRGCCLVSGFVTE